MSGRHPIETAMMFVVVTIGIVGISQTVSVPPIPESGGPFVTALIIALLGVEVVLQVVTAFVEGLRRVFPALVWSFGVFIALQFLGASIDRPLAPYPVSAFGERRRTWIERAEPVNVDDEVPKLVTIGECLNCGLTDVPGVRTHYARELVAAGVVVRTREHGSIDADCAACFTVDNVERGLRRERDDAAPPKIGADPSTGDVPEGRQIFAHTTKDDDHVRVYQPVTISVDTPTDATDDATRCAEATADEGSAAR